jgi:Ras-related protein Rab-8A
MGIVMAFSVDDYLSFQSLENWLKQIKLHASGNVVKILVGNKCDLKERKVSYEEGKKMAEQFGIEYF